MGCGLLLKYGKVTDHDDECVHREVICTICDTKQPITKLTSHRLFCNEYAKDVRCSKCGCTVKNTMIKEHFSTSLKANRQV